MILSPTMQLWLKSGEGQELLALLNNEYPTNEPAFDRHDTHLTAYRQGQRDVLLALNKAAGYDPHAPGAPTTDQQLENIIRFEDLKA